MLTENQVLAALGEAIQLALSTAVKPGLIREARISKGEVVLGVIDDGATRYVNVMVEPVEESMMPAQAEEPPGPPDADPEGAPESTEAPGAAQDVRDTTEDAGPTPQSAEVLGKMPAPRPPAASDASNKAEYEGSG